jgi:hypothetical protein
MKTDKELADIGAAAALAKARQIDQRRFHMALSDVSGYYADDAPAREAFARAVAEEVRSEQERENLTTWQQAAEAWEKRCLKAEAQLAEKVKLIEQAIEMVNTPGTTAETLPRAINAKIMQRDEYHGATIRKLDEAQGEIQRLLKLDGDNRDQLERTHKALIEAQLVYVAAQQQLAEKEARLAKEIERREFEESMKTVLRELSERNKELAWNVWQAARAALTKEGVR